MATVLGFVNILLAGNDAWKWIYTIRQSLLISLPSLCISVIKFAELSLKENCAFKINELYYVNNYMLDHYLKLSLKRRKKN